MSKPVICFICDRVINPGETCFSHPVDTKGHPICEECTRETLMELVDVEDLAVSNGWTVDEVPKETPEGQPEPIPVLPGQMDMWGNEH
jgi:hypothetical protein